MAKTRLDLEVAGFERLAQLLDELIAKGVPLTEAFETIWDQAAKGSQEAVAAQQGFDRSIASTVGTMSELRAISKLTLNELRAQQRQVAQDIAKVNKAIAGKNVGEEEGLKIVKDLAKEYAKLDEAVADLTEQLAQSAEQALSLRTQIQNAEKEAAEALDQYGQFSPQFQEAAEKAALLKQEMKDVREAIAVIQPEEKLRVIGGLVENIAGGFAAVQGVLALTGNTSEQTAQRLLKVQSALTAVLGISSFFRNFAENVKLLNRWIIAATTSTEALTVAEGAQAGASTAAATATGTLTGAVRTLSAAMAANPLLTAAVVIAGIAAAVVALGDDTEDTKEQVDDLIGSLEELDKIRAIIQNRRKLDLEFERQYQDLISGDIDLNERLGIIAKRTQEDLVENAGLINNARRAQAAEYELMFDRVASVDKDLIASAERVKVALEEAGDDVQAKFEALAGFAQEAKKNLEGDDLAGVNTLIDALRERIVAEEGHLNDRRAINARFTLDQAKAFEEQARKDQEELEKRRKAAEDNYRELLKLRSDFDREVEQLARNAESAARDGRIAELEYQADLAAKNGQLQQEKEFRDQILAEQEATALAQVDQLRENLERKLAVIKLNETLGVEAVKKLGEAQRRALEDQLIADGNVTLSTEQLEQFENLKLLVQEEFGRKRVALAIRIEQSLMDVEDQAIKDQLAALRTRQEYAEAQLENAEGDAEKIKQILLDNGVEQVEGVRDVEEAKLAILIQYAEQQIAILEATGSQQDAIVAEQLRRTIAKAKEATTSGPLIDWKTILGLNDQELQSIQNSAQSIQASYNTIIQGALFAINAEIEGIDRVISERERNIQDLETQWQREQDLSEQGLANNKQRLQEQIEAQRAALQKDREQRRQALEERKRIAKQQLAVDAAIQGSKLLLSTAQIIESLTSDFGWAGLIAAAAAVAALFALFSSYQAKSKAISSQNDFAGSFAEGTPWLERGKYKPGRDTIPIMADEGERIIPRSDNEKHWHILEGLRKGDKDQLRKGILETAEAFGLDTVDMPRIDRGLSGRIRKNYERAEEDRVAKMIDRHMHQALDRIAASNEELLERERKRKTRTAYREGDVIIEEQGDTVRYVKTGKQG